MIVLVSFNNITRVICNWCDENDLKLNATKTKAVIFGTRREISSEYANTA